MPKRKPELASESSGFDSEVFPTPRAGKPERELVSFFELPHYTDNESVHPRHRGEFVMSLPNTDDVEEQFKKHHRMPGWYAVELRVGGKIADTWALEIQHDERTVKADAPIPMPEPSGEGLTAAYVALVVQQALAQQQKDFAKLLEAQREEVRQTTSGNGSARQESFADQLTTTLTVMQKMKEMNGSGEPKRAESSEDQFDKFLNMYDRITTINERVNPSGDASNAGAVRQAMATLDGILAKAPSLVAAWRGKGSTAASTNGGGGLNVTDDLKPFEPMLSVIVEDMTADAPVERAAATVESFVKNNKELTPQLEMLFAMSPPDLLAFIAETTGAGYLTRLPHSVGWMQNFAEDLRERIGEESGDG